VPLQLLEYRVFRQSVPLATANEIDGDVVPTNQTWRVAHLSLAVFFPPGVVMAAQNTPPMVGIYDVATPGAQVVPCQVTQLSPLAVGGQIGGVTVPGGTASSGVLNSWFDADDDAGITLSPGNQLAVVFYTDEIGGPSPVGAVRAEYATFQGVPGQPTPIAGSSPNPVPAAI
jgi:hypothetical protein